MMKHLLKELFKLFKKILKWIEDHWEVLLVIAAIVAIAIFFPGAFAAAWTWISETFVPALGKMLAATGKIFADLGVAGSIATALGIGLLIDPEGTSHAIGEIIESVGSATGSVIGDTAGAVLDSVLGSNLTWVVGGVLLAAYLLPKFFGNDDVDSKDTKPYASGGSTSRLTANVDGDVDNVTNHVSNTRLRDADIYPNI